MVMDPFTVDGCRMPWYQSLTMVSDTGFRPRCIWIDGSGKTKDRIANDSHGDFTNSPTGFPFDVEAFMRREWSEANAKQ